jgi:hypothetical protein
VGWLRADTGSYSRLLVSLGLLAIAVSFVVPWLFMRETKVLSISQTDLNGLTPRGRHVLEDRQDLIDALQPVAPWFSLLFVSLGGASLALGMKRMRLQQQWQDRQLQAETRKAEASIEEQSEEQQEERVREEVETDRELAPAELATGDLAQRPPIDRSRAIAATRAIETEVLNLIESRKSDAYDFVSHPRIRGSGSDLLMDGLLRNLSGGVDVVVEVKRQQRANLHLPQIVADQLLSRVARYEAITGRKAVGWLVLVIDGEANDEDMARLHDRLEDSLRPLGHADVIPRDNLDSLIVWDPPRP